MKQRIQEDLKALIIELELYALNNPKDMEIRGTLNSLRGTTVGRQVLRELYLQKKEAHQLEKGKSREQRKEEYEEKQEETKKKQAAALEKEKEETPEKELNEMRLKDLRILATSKGIKSASKMNKATVIEQLESL